MSDERDDEEYRSQANINLDEFEELLAREIYGREDLGDDPLNINGWLYVGTI